MYLKNYQSRAIDVLKKYLDAVQVTNQPEAEFRKIDEPPHKYAEQPYKYHWKDMRELDGVPYVCLQLPTGGGKTLLASYAAGLAARYTGRDSTIVLWLVPSNIIEQQTIEALKKPGHPYREALEKAFDSRVAVFGADDIWQIRVKDLEEKTCIVVLTIQTLRIKEEKSDKRNIYRSYEDFAPHFARLPSDIPGMMRDEDGKALLSFVNILHALRPVVIIDEAHKAVSQLTGEMMRRIHPSCVVEFTATPEAGNVLWRVYPTDLKREEMVKLPFELNVHTNWEMAVASAVARQRELEVVALRDTDYIRPIVLFQAQNKNSDVTVDILREHLIANENIPSEHIAIATGSQRELDDIDLFDPSCPIRFIITVQALKEGWDCSMAYVFCSVANVKSSTDVQQLLGRVMRMPYAKLRSKPELNVAYADVISPSFFDAVEDMKGNLTQMGFDAEEVTYYLQPGEGESRTLDFPFTLEMESCEQTQNFVRGLTPEENEQVKIVETSGGTVRIEVTGHISRELETKILQAVPEHDREKIRFVLKNRIDFEKRVKPPSENELFKLPKLCYVPATGGLLFPIEESEDLFGDAPWELNPNDGVFMPAEFAYQSETKTFEFDVNMDNRLQYRILENQSDGRILYGYRGWTEAEFISWLTYRLGAFDLMQTSLHAFVANGVRSLLNQGVSLSELVIAKFALLRAFEEKIGNARRNAATRAYQHLLFDDDSSVETRYEFPVVFDSTAYPLNRKFYDGGYVFTKHFYPRIVELDSKGEEFECAVALDQNPAVEYWLRNPANSPWSFRLLLESGRHFYPDFVGKLKDGRVFCIEYKGAHLSTTDDSKEKEIIGLLWARRSNGKAVFLMAAAKDDQGNDMREQIDHALI